MPCCKKEWDERAQAGGAPASSVELLEDCVYADDESPGQALVLISRAGIVRVGRLGDANYRRDTLSTAQGALRWWRRRREENCV